MGERKSKLNCWEFMKCGRQPGGSKVYEHGLCSAATDSRLDGIHDGVNSGRACWVIAGTLCGGEVQGSFAQKFSKCEKCDFYKAVRGGEYPNFLLTATLMSILKKNEMKEGASVLVA